MMRRRRAERGQAIILFVGVMTVIFVIAAISIDFGIWMSERRGSQKDADASSLAGAHELLGQNFVDPVANEALKPSIKAAAEDAAYDWADRNGVPSTDVHDLQVYEGNCFGNSAFLDTVELKAEHHSKALFSSIFGFAAPQIGAPATACLGSIISAEGLLPVGVQIEGFDSECWDDVDGDGQEDPLYGEECTLTFGGGDFTSGEGGALRLYNDGSINCSGPNAGGGRTYRDEISGGGAETTCFVLPEGETCSTFPNGCVYPLTGNLVGNERQGYQTLIGSDGDCDALYSSSPDGTDDFEEVVELVSGGPEPGPTTVYSERDCDPDTEDLQRSPRLVSLVIVDQFTAQGNPPKPIRAFAGFYIEKCENPQNGRESVDCDFQAMGNPGHVEIHGRFVNILVTNGMVGGINRWSPRKIILKE